MASVTIPHSLLSVPTLLRGVRFRGRVGLSSRTAGRHDKSTSRAVAERTSSETPEPIVSSLAGSVSCARLVSAPMSRTRCDSERRVREVGRVSGQDNEDESAKVAAVCFVMDTDNVLSLP